jgi:hypothetical protein
MFIFEATAKNGLRRVLNRPFLSKQDFPNIATWANGIADHKVKMQSLDLYAGYGASRHVDSA